MPLHTQCTSTQFSLVTHFALDYGYYYCKCCCLFVAVTYVPRPHKRPHSENSGKNNPEHSQTHEHQGTKHKKTKRDRENNNNRKNDTIENCPRAIYLYYSSSTYFPSNFPLPCVSLWANVCFPFCHLFFCFFFVGRTRFTQFTVLMKFAFFCYILGIIAGAG